ncbi:MAG: glutathione S-transferase family protein [Nevskiales bacterium]|nr:glutathione S-transferase family protein [Nevskiales bacterium]
MQDTEPRFSAMRLYSARMAVSPLRVQLFLAEKNVQIPETTLDLLKGEQRSAEYQRIAPNMRVPTLMLPDGTVIRESLAICRYIEALMPEPALFGRGALQQALVEQWQRIMELELLQPMAMAFRHGHPMARTIQEQVPEFGVQARAAALKRIAILNRELADRLWIAGEGFSVADLTAFAALRAFRFADFSIPEEHANLTRWFDAVRARPAIHARFKAWGAK